MAVGSSTALADTTHVFERYIDIPGVEDVQPVDVDAQGNLLIWRNDTNDLIKVDPNGNPVNFSALGTNVIDGAGSFDCPNTPSDCDQMQTTNGFQNGTNSTGYIRNIVGVDHSNGPASGYIYITNNYRDLDGREQGETDVFAASGKYMGKLDETQPFPNQFYLKDWWRGGVSVGSDGAVYVVASSPLSRGHVDRYVPVDGNPAHTQFAGQIRAACANSICVAQAASFATGAAGAHYYYARGEDATHGTSVTFMRFKMSEFRRPGGEFAQSDNFSPDPGPFGTGGYNPPTNTYLDVIGVDPGTEHVYVGGSYTGAGFSEWDENMEQIGPVFGSNNQGPVNSIAFDSSGGPADGSVYFRGPATNRISVFSPPVIIPDIGDPHVEVGHTTATLSVNIGRAGGSEVTSCRVEWGFQDPGSGPYQYSTPCDQPLPFAADTTATASFSGLTPETDYHYRVVAGNSTAENRTKDLVFHTVAVLGVQTDPATNLDRTSGDLNGSLNPDGMETKYFFEFGSTERYNNRTPERIIAPSSGQQPVPPEHVEGLQAGRTYHYRLVAKNELGKTKGPDRTFLVPANPTIAGVHASGVGERFADLNARINPLGFDTTYYFEYGSTPSYGSRTPEVALGSQLDPQLVTAHIEGFEPGVIHFRVVAENKWGKTVTPNSTFSFSPPDCPNSHVRQQTDANYLPDCRAYELVSPGNAGNVTLFPGDLTKGADGGFTFPPYLRTPSLNPGGLASAPPRFAFIGAMGAIPGLTVPNGFMDRYLATRTTHGWVTTYPGRPGDEYLIAARPQCSLSMDVCMDYQIELPFGFGGTFSYAPFVWDAEGGSLGRWPTNLALVPNGDQFIVDDEPSGDYSHYVFSSVNAPFAPGGNEGPPGTVYDNDISEKTVTIASILPGGGQIPQEEAAGADPNRKTEIAAVSADGSHILMAATTNPFCDKGPFEPCPSKLASPAHLYMRVNGAVTYEVSPGATAVFQGMTSNGAFVFFTSESQLTPEDTDASVDLYRWSEQSGQLEILSQGNGRGNVDDCTAQWTSACDVRPVVTQRPELDDTFANQSGDIYFYSPEQLDPANPGVRNERNLYVFRNGAPRYVTTIDPGTQVDRMQISPDGSHMAFLSATQATAYVNTAPNDSGVPTQWREMYVFDPATSQVQCASCLPSGAPPTILKADIGFGGNGHNYNVEASASGRFMSDDGRVGFSTADALVPGDTNQKIDVYEFVENGAKLITSGTDERDRQGGALFYPTLNTGFEAISRDGVDLYFSTFETFVPEDHNGSFVKFYDARTGGGFPIRTELLPCAAADECHGDASTTPQQFGMGTLGDLGSGGNHPLKKASKKKKKRRHGAKKPKRGKHRRAAR
jgi:hypothetical protein